MRLTRVFVSMPLATGRRQLLDGSAANHIMRVLRLRVGDRLTLFDGTGGEYGASVDELHRDIVWVNVLEHRTLERESPLQLTLAQGISRGERMDWVVQKATELGATCVKPLFTERSVVRLDPKQSERKLEHWRSIAVAACEQSGRNQLPTITTPLGLQELLDDMRSPALTTPPRPGIQQPATCLLLAPEAPSRIGDIAAADNVIVLIGPEGGLTDNEREAASAAGFRPVQLGPRVLRTETAAVAALTILQQRFGDL